VKVDKWNSHCPLSYALPKTLAEKTAEKASFSVTRYRAIP